jgi:DHA2 family multidrug resistance protein
MPPDGQAAGEPPLGNARRWAITVTVMLVSVLQILDTRPLQMLALASVPISQLPNATTLFSVVRNVGGSAGVAISTTLLSRRAQTHQSALVAHVNIWDPETAERLRQWTDHFVARGADTVTAGRQAMAMLYRETQVQAQVLAFMDDFRVLAVMYAALVGLVILMRRVRTTPAQATQFPPSPP